MNYNDDQKLNANPNKVSFFHNENSILFQRLKWDTFTPHFSLNLRHFILNHFYQLAPWHNALDNPCNLWYSVHYRSVTVVRCCHHLITSDYSQSSRHTHHYLNWWRQATNSLVYAKAILIPHYSMALHTTHELTVTYLAYRIEIISSIPPSILPSRKNLRLS